MDAQAERKRSELGLRHVLYVFATPRALFSRVEDTGAYGWALAVLICLVMAMGYTLTQSGLIDRVVDQQTEVNLAQLEIEQGTLVDRIELREAMDDVRQQGEFNKTIARLGAVVLEPVFLLASFLFNAAIFYAIVALTGRKPEWHTLMSICVYSGFIELLAHVTRLAMVFYYRSLEVDTTLRALAPSGEPTPLAGIDPFRIWYWGLAATGLIVTRQLSRRMAIISCSLMCLIAIGVRVAMEFNA